MINNWYALTAFLISFLSLLVYAFFLMPKQINEVLRPKDWLTRLRWIILTILAVSILTSIPGVVYQYSRVLGDESDFLRNFVTISSNISRLASTVLLVLVFTYRKKE